MPDSGIDADHFRGSRSRADSGQALPTRVTPGVERSVERISAIVRLPPDARHRAAHRRFHRPPNSLAGQRL